MRIQNNLNSYQQNNINFKALGFPEGFAKIEMNCLDKFNLLVDKSTHCIYGYNNLPNVYKCKIEQCLLTEQHLSNIILKGNEADKLNALALKEDPEAFTEKAIEIIRKCKRLLKAELIDMNSDFLIMSISSHIDTKGRPFFEIIHDIERIAKEISEQIAKKLDES